jgi:hypothetical protein
VRKSKSRQDAKASDPVPVRHVACINRRCDRHGQHMPVPVGTRVHAHVLFIPAGTYTCTTCGYEMKTVEETGDAPR